MPNVVRSVSRLVDQDDVASLLGVLVDGCSLAYDAASGGFVLRRMATYDSVFGETAGALAALFDAHAADANAHCIALTLDDIRGVLRAWTSPIGPHRWCVGFSAVAGVEAIS